ncbi:hypothetical protein N8977_02355, partial [Alphaproteobacteria bacterium]|nr:hypothetical protein [Alphaproteobacteria bacterium]
CSSVKLIDSDGNYIGSSNIIHKKPSFANALVESIAAGHTMVFNLSLIKIFTQIPPDRKVTSHDWMLYQLCTGFNGQVYCYPRPLVCYRQHSTNVIGDGRSIHVFGKRLLFFFNGRFKTRLDANARLLEKFVGQFEASSQKTFFQSQRIRQANICLRLMVWRLPLKRQSYLETWLVRVGVLFGLV